MAGRREKARFGDAGLFRLPLGGVERVRGLATLGHVGEGDDDALRGQVASAIGQNSAHEPGVVLARDFTFDGDLSVENVLGVDEEIAFPAEGFEVGQRPTDIAGDHMEQRLGGRSEEPDIEMRVEKDRRDVGAVEDVLQIVGERALALQRLLKLAVEGAQLLVERLQLLLGSHQLLVLGLELLVHQDGFVVDGGLLGAPSLKIAYGRLEFGAGGVDIAFEFGAAGRLC